MLKVFRCTHNVVLVASLSISITKVNNPWAFYKEQNISSLHSYQKTFLEDMATSLELAKLGSLFEVNKASEFLSNRREDSQRYGYSQYYTSLEKIAKKTLEIESITEKYKFLIKIVEDVIKGGRLPIEKPSDIEFHIYEKIKLISEKIQYILVNEEELKDIEKNLKPLIQKVEKQLDIIHNALNDDTALTRIEGYSNVFEKGNFENLVKIVEAHHKQKNT